MSRLQTFLKRGISTLILWAIVISIIASFNPVIYLAAITLVVALAVYEYGMLMKRAKVYCHTKFLWILAFAYSVSISAFYIYHLKQGDAVGIHLPTYIEWVFWMILMIGSPLFSLRYPVKGIQSLLAISTTVLGFAYLPFLFHFLTRIIFIVPANEGVVVSGIWYLVWVVAVTKFTDVGAYVVGSLCGKDKMIPHISPGKTWQGCLGGVAIAVIVGVGIKLILGVQLIYLGSLPWVIGLSIILAILAIIGDLMESILKRSLEIKDSGKVIPGIGGVLDLIDSLCFTAPIMYAYLLWQINL